jgi:hypothetical protein
MDVNMLFPSIPFLFCVLPLFFVDHALTPTERRMFCTGP